MTGSEPRRRDSGSTFCPSSHAKSRPLSGMTSAERAWLCSQVRTVSEERSNRSHVRLDEERTTKPHAVAKRIYVQPGTIARSLLSNALDQAAPDAATIAEILDSIPGAAERAQEGLAAARAGRFVPLDELRSAMARQWLG